MTTPRSAVSISRRGIRPTRGGTVQASGIPAHCILIWAVVNPHRHQHAMQTAVVAIQGALMAAMGVYICMNDAKMFEIHDPVPVSAISTISYHANCFYWDKVRQFLVHDNKEMLQVYNTYWTSMIPVCQCYFRTNERRRGPDKDDLIIINGDGDVVTSLVTLELKWVKNNNAGEPIAYECFECKTQIGRGWTICPTEGCPMMTGFSSLHHKELIVPACQELSLSLLLQDNERKDRIERAEKIFTQAGERIEMEILEPDADDEADVPREDRPSASEEQTGHVTVPRIDFTGSEQITDFYDLSEDHKNTLMNYMNGTLDSDPDASSAKLNAILTRAHCSSRLVGQITTMLSNIKKLYFDMKRENPREHVKDLLVAIVNTMKSLGVWRLGWRPNVKFDVGTGVPRDPGFFMLHAAQGVCFEM